MSIAKAVYDAYQATGQLAVPDGQKAVTISLPMSSDHADTGRSLHMIFQDGSEVSLHVSGATVGWTDAGVNDLSTLDDFLISLKGRSAQSISESLTIDDQSK